MREIMKFKALALMMSLSLSVQASQTKEWVHSMGHNPSDDTFVTTESGEKTRILTGTHLNNKTKMTIEFNMIAHDYFTNENVGHIAILVGGNLYPDGTNSGQGVVIGNVTGYDKQDGICEGNQRINSVSVETFYPNGNCVYPDDIGITFRNNVIYNIRITVDKANNTVTADVEDEYGNGNNIVVKTHNNDVAKHGNTWAITEIMGVHSWSVHFTSPKITSSW